MNFRLPFQISRVSAICQSSSPVNLISKFTPIYGNHVKNSNQDKQHTAHHTRIITTKCTYRAFHSPFNVFQQKAFLHNLARTEEAVKQRVRQEQCCDYQIPEEPKLAFRQSSKIQCYKCVDYKPCVAPPLVRPAKLYDDSKCQYVHKCNPDLCNINPRRMDDVCCPPIEKRKLPRLPDCGNCRPCVDYLKRPKLLPRLCKPTKFYDPEKMKYDHGVCTEPKCIRQDDVRGYKVEAKELPVIPRNDCQPCLASRPLTAPTLSRPFLRYDPTCIPYPHPDCPDDDDAPRRDNFCCEPIYRKLPPMPCSDCIPCQQYTPTISPALRRPCPRYDSTEMKYKHECPTSPCDTPCLRRDNNNNIISVTLTRKKLPPLNGDNTCQPCIEYRPLTAPELNHPVPCNNNMQEEQNRSHCREEMCIRRDGQIEICRRCLPPVPIAHCCKPCLDIFTPCTTPKFIPPMKLYDDSTCKYRHKCIPVPCEEHPRRLDDTCYKITRKVLPKPPDSPDCKPCKPCIKTAPRLCRPCKSYDDSKQKYQHPECPEDPCLTTPRADDYTGCKDEVKTLQPFKALKCKPCQQYFPTRAPELCRPRARYDDTCMLYDHKNCPPPCDGSIFRRDHYLWEGPKKLPKVKCGMICEPCQQSYPSVAPPIGRPHKLYEFPHDPVRVKECPPECPPRRDDLFCWKPKRKKLPSFKDCDQSCCYSTLSWSNNKSLKGPVSKLKLFSKGKTDLRHFSTNCTKRSDMEKYKSKLVLKEKSISDPKQADQKDTKSEARYYIVKEPTWKCIDVSKTRTTNEKNLQKKYDYSIEKWLREGAEQIVQATSKSISKRRIRDHVPFSRYENHTKFSTGSECITPVRFTGFDKSGCNEFLCIKKNNKLQPLRVGSAFKLNDTCDKAQIKSTMVNINVNEKPKEQNKQFTFSTIIEERITQRIPSTPSIPTSNFILKLNNNMRSTLFQKLSNFFKRRENAARDRKILDALKNEPNVIVKRNSTSLKEEFMANVCEKYNIQVDTDKLKMERSKPYIVQKYKRQGLKIKIDKPGMCCSSSSKPANKQASKRDETTNKVRSLPKKIKIRTDQIRNFSTQSKGGQLYYKHIDISDDYIGKIYKVKLKKIGVKNLMLEKNDPDKRDEEPHTICYICKVVPRYQPIVHDDPPDIENVKINYYREKRNTIE